MYRIIFTGLLAVLLAATMSCKKPDGIEVSIQPIEKQDDEEYQAIEEVTGPEKERFLAAVVPAGDGYFWTVRFKANTAIVNHYEEDFYTFLKSLKLPATSNDAPKWEIPKGWRISTPSDRMAAGFRWVTLHTGPKNKPVEMYLSKPASGSMLENVNRWRTSFVGIDPITNEELPALLKPFDIDGTKASIIDLRGPGGKGGMTPPFAGK